MRLLGLALLVVVGCGVSRDEYAQRVDEAQLCNDGDTCVLAGGNDCSCPAPVNAGSAAEIDALASEVSCCDPFGACVAVDCARLENLRCENGRCTGDFAEP
jgi:hypothetical protein